LLAGVVSITSVGITAIAAGALTISCSTRDADTTTWSVKRGMMSAGSVVSSSRSSCPSVSCAGSCSCWTVAPAVSDWAPRKTRETARDSRWLRGMPLTFID